MKPWVFKIRRRIFTIAAPKFILLNCKSYPDLMRSQDYEHARI